MPSAQPRWSTANEFRGPQRNPGSLLRHTRFVLPVASGADSAKRPRNSGDIPELIGEASILMAQTCFPDNHLDGGTGHDDVDVLYVIFGDKVPSGVGEKTIDIAALKELGGQAANDLADTLRV